MMASIEALVPRGSIAASGPQRSGWALLPDRAGGGWRLPAGCVAPR